MKKFSMFLKRTILVVLPALFACSLSVGQLHDVKPVHAEEISSSENESDYDVENDIYTIRKTGDHSLELLFSANPKVYKNFRKNHLTELKNALMDILKDVVHTKISELAEIESPVDTDPVSGTGDEADHREETYTGGSLPAMNYDVGTYVSAETFATMVTNYCSLNDGSSYHNLHEITSSVVTGYAFYYVRDHIARNNLENDAETRAKVFSDFCVVATQRLQGAFAESADAIYSQLYGAGEGIISDEFAINLDYITGMLLLVQDESESGVSNAGVLDLLATIGGQSAKSDILDVISNSSSAQIKNFFLICPTNVISAVLDEIEFTGADLNDLMETVGVDTFLEIAGEIGVERTREIIQNVPYFDKTDFINKVTALTGAREVWNAIKNIHIDGVLVMQEKQFQWDGLVELFEKIAPMSKLRNLEDEKWRHEFHIVLDTSVEEVQLDVTLGFKGNCKWLRKAAGIIDDHIKVEVVDGKYIIKVDVPNFLANMYRYILEADFLDDDLKHELWDLAFSTVDEAYEHVHEKTIWDLEENAEQIDYHILAQSIISADEIKAFFGISRFITQERVDQFIDKLFEAIDNVKDLKLDPIYELVDRFYEIPEDMKDKIDKIYEKAIALIKRIAARNYNAQDLHDLLSEYTSEEFNERINNKIDYYLENARVTSYYNRAQRLLEKVYARVPARFRNVSLMDYYKGNSTWEGSGSVHFNITKLIRKIPKVGSKIADALSAMFDHFPTDLSLDLSFTGHDLYRISYHLGDEVKTGALPINTNATFWANATQVLDNYELHDIVGWAEKRQNAYTYLDDMPARDVDAYPIWFVSSADVEKAYDGLESTIEVTPNIEVEHNYSYIWFKDGVILDGENESSITVKNHSDSGTYYCYVDGVKQAEIIVSIDQIEVVPPTQSVDIVWDGESHAYYTSFGETSEDDLLFHGTGDVEATEPGDYVVELELNDPDNYYWGEGSTSYSWTISKQVIEISESDVIWDYAGPFTYDGEEKSVHLLEEHLPDGVHVTYTNNAKTNAGAFSAVAKIVPDDAAHYVVRGKTNDTLSWKIERAHITIPADIALIQSDFTYDGEEHSPKLNEDQLPAGITGVNYSGQTKATEMGEYVVEVSYSYDRANYILDPDYQKEFSWKISPRKIDVSNVTWDYTTPFSYDESEHRVALVGVPTGVKVEYTGTVKATRAGTYIANAKLYTTSSCKLIYNGEERDTVGLQLEWKIVEGAPIPVRSEFYSVEQNEGGTSLVWVSLSTGIKGDYTLHAEDVDTSKYDFNSIIHSGSVDVVACYDINLFDESGELAHINVDAAGKVVDPNFKFTVRILVPDSYKDHELALVYVNESGQVEKLEGTLDGNYMVFTTNHLSIYGLVETHVAGSESFPYLAVAAALALGVQATTCWILIVLAKRKRRTVK